MLNKKILSPSNFVFFYRKVRIFQIIYVYGEPLLSEPNFEGPEPNFEDLASHRFLSYYIHTRLLFAALKGR